MSAERAVYTILAAESDVTDLTSTRINVGTANNTGLAMPYIVYSRISTDHTGRIQGVGTDNLPASRIQVDSYAATHTAARTLADAVKAALDGYSGAAGSDTVRWIMIDGDDYHPEYNEKGAGPPNAHVVFQDFIVWVTE
jgi:hypothetical protein